MDVIEKVNVVLSILVITHNQRELLKRCLKSVLGQKLNVPFEVIVSDDRSDDGTAEYMEELHQRFADGKLNVANLQEIVYSRCNSNDCAPTNISERCGWNKLNAYIHAHGEYFVNIDADDYLKSDTIYQAQLDMLMVHPECSMCMQDVWQVNEGAPLSTGHAWPSDGHLSNGEILSVQRSIQAKRALNQCYMTRRHPEDDMMDLYGKFFDDTIITLHHLQYGPVIYINRADYVWVKYSNSITATLQGDDELALYALLPLHHYRFIPCFADIYMKEGLTNLIHLFRVLSNQHYLLNLSERTLIEFGETNGYIYRAFCRKRPSMWDQIKLRYIRIVLLLTVKYKWNNYRYLYHLLTN